MKHFVAGHCISCGWLADRTCDFLGRNPHGVGVCGVAICNRCTTSGGENIDYCRPHAKVMQVQKRGHAAR